jgi:glutamate-ammonia-ligase adenylyltransferase
MGFRNPREASAMIRHWLAGAPARVDRQLRAHRLAELVPLLLPSSRARQSGRRADRLRPLSQRACKGGRLLSLLRRNPDLTALIAVVLGSAARLAEGPATFPTSWTRSSIRASSARSRTKRARRRACALARAIRDH